MSIAATETVNLDQIREEYAVAAKQTTRRIIVCAGTGCVANGALVVHSALVRGIESAGLDVVTELRTEDHAAESDANHGMWVSKSGCQGFCQMGPLVTIEPDGLLYVHVKEEDVDEIVMQTLRDRKVIHRLLYVDPSSESACRGTREIPFYTRQSRTVLKACGEIDPDDIRAYIGDYGYTAAQQAYLDMTPEVICDEITLSGLRGRGGGGFPTGRKWTLTLKQPGPKKYVICNGDEGDPGAFMDRSVMEGNPHGVIEGIMIAARAIGADEAYVYVRAEYPLAVQRVRRAVEEATAYGILGDNVFGSGLKLTCHVMEGAGAFVCGEETALIASVEGRRGMPMPKPPFPAQKGLWNKPTVINNVETLASIPLILRMGAAEYRKLGTEGSPGTKTFALTGHVANTGLIEVPFGSTLREIVFNIGGGVTNDRGVLRPENFKAVQIGGPSGGCLTEEHLDLPLDFDSLRGIGAMVGSGGLVAMNTDTCMVKMARFFMQFTQNESCGKCVPCREGTKQMLALLDRIIDGTATEQTLDLLQKLAVTVQKAPLCGLGKTAPNPVLSTFRNFRAELEAHVYQKRCPAGSCAALVDYAIDSSLCTSCGLCAFKCPVGAIEGSKTQPYTITDETCIRCGECIRSCNSGAIVRS